MDKEIKYMDIKEFRETGILFELNRCFLHPLGLALEVKIDKDGNETLGGIWDYREDPEGMYYGNEIINSESAKIKSQNVVDMLTEKLDARMKLFGSVVQPIGGDSK